MIAPTSPRGRCQLSAEKANSVRAPMPSVGAASTTRRTASAPARCPATRGSPLRVAQRPFPSITTATCRAFSAPDSKLLCITKLPHKNFSGRRPSLREAPTRTGGFGARGARSIAHYALQHRQVVEEPPAPGRRQPAGRQRPVVAESFRDLYQTRLFEDAQMAAQIAVGQLAELLQRAEGESLRMRRE